MAGLSLFLLALLASPLAAAPQDTVPVLAGVVDRDLSFKDLVIRTYDPRWMMQSVIEGEQVETLTWSLDSMGHASVTATGQGAVARIWLSQAASRIRVYADGAQQPSLDWDLESLFSNPLPAHLNSPLFTQVGDGFVCRIPLPFADSVRIDFDAAADSGLYGDVAIRRFGKDVALEPLTPGLLEGNLRSLRFAAQYLHNNSNPEIVGEAPMKYSGSFRDHERNPLDGADYFYGDFRVALLGNGVLRWFEIEFVEKYSPQEMHKVLRGLTLRMELNTVKATEIGDIMFEVPLGDFLGTAPGLNPFTSHLIGYHEDSGIFYFRMPVPYTGGLKVSLSSDLPDRTIIKTRWAVNKYSKAEEVPSMRLHSGWAYGNGTSTPTAAQLNIPGQARLLGYTFSSTAAVADPQVFAGPFSFVNSWQDDTGLTFERLTLREGPGSFGNTSAFRLFGLDAPTSSDGLEFNPGITLASSVPTSYSALAWWYAPADATSSFPTDAPLKKRWPMMEPKPGFHLVSGAFECESLGGMLMASGSIATVVEAADLSAKWSRLQYLDWQPSAAKQVLNFPFPVEQTGRYVLFAQFAKGASYGKVQVLVDGRRVGDELDFSGAHLSPSGEIEIGELRLMKRLNHKIAFLTVDGKAIGLDYFRLRPVASPADSDSSGD